MVYHYQTSNGFRLKHFFHSPNSDEEIQIWNECARLVANAIIYFNSKVLSNLLDSFEYQGHEKKLEQIKRASPVAWENINFQGTYTFAPTGELPKLEYLMATIEGYLPVLEKERASTSHG